jgi:hypothetical protein
MALAFHFLNPLGHIDFGSLGQIGVTLGHIGIGKQECRKKRFMLEGQIGLSDYAKLT